MVSNGIVPRGSSGGVITIGGGSYLLLLLVAIYMLASVTTLSY